jgi:hypothetical protein
MFLDTQPDADPIQFTHYDCWFLPEGEDYSLAYLDDALANNPTAVADRCENVFGSWCTTLKLDVPPGHYADLFMQTGGGWPGIEACERDATTRASNAGYCVFQGEAFWEIYPRDAAPDDYKIWVAVDALYDVWNACRDMKLELGALDSVAYALEVLTGLRPEK